MEQEDKKIYLEFVFEGVIKVDEKDVEAIEKRIAKLVNKVFKENKTARLSTHISKYSEEEIIMSAFNDIGDSEYEN